MKVTIRDDSGQVVSERYFETDQATVVAVLAPETETTKAVLETQHGYLRPAQGFGRIDRVLACGFVAVAFVNSGEKAAQHDQWWGVVLWLYVAVMMGHFGRRLWRALR